MPAIDLTAALAGLGVGLSLIIAIGAQNAFVLRQGIRREHVGIVVAVCALSDLLLIAAGVGGVGAVVNRSPLVITVVSWVGAAVLVGYGLLAARRAARGGSLHASTRSSRGAGAVLGTALALTWLNPHVYLDTVLLLGSVASTHGPTGRWWFGAGAGVGSVVWFTTVGFGARLLGPLFARPLAWRVLDGAIAVIMITMGLLLALRSPAS